MFTGTPTWEYIERVFEVGLELSIAGRAVLVLLDLAERIPPGRRDAAERADHVPLKFQEPGTDGPQAGLGELGLVHAQPTSDGDRADAGNLLVGGRRQVLAEPIGHFTPHPGRPQSLDPGPQALAAGARQVGRGLEGVRDWLAGPRGGDGGVNQPVDAAERAPGLPADLDLGGQPAKPSARGRPDGLPQGGPAIGPRHQW